MESRVTTLEETLVDPYSNFKHIGTTHVGAQWHDFWAGTRTPGDTLTVVYLPISTVSRTNEGKDVDFKYEVTKTDGSLQTYYFKGLMLSELWDINKAAGSTPYTTLSGIYYREKPSDKWLALPDTNSSLAINERFGIVANPYLVTTWAAINYFARLA